ncbi:Rieske 2Fe-2S domain-containing protein [Streptosporangium sp. NPDC051022]|uniref:Rieske 2Fe-2S domain-containing protein n=1 Tax=Streptosporangium sp. NPDC051022 TaxID=3155752 RepID=UPI00342D9C8C
MTTAPGATNSRMYEPYVRANWGLVNHWYPALFSAELPEDSVKGITVSGIAILLRRKNGKLYAIDDTCLHRGVKMSAKPTCLTADTISCWYHGFTYRLEDGVLHSIAAAPDDSLIGKVGLRTFPVEERNGIIFVFVYNQRPDVIPPLAADLPISTQGESEHPVAGVLDDDTVLLGLHRTVKANWRLAAENGFDPGHVLIHRDATVVVVRDQYVPLGYRPLSEKAVRTIDEDPGPKGLMNMYGTEHYELVRENPALNIKAVGNTRSPGLRTSIYLPGVLMVENFPDYGTVQYEWYVPLDADHHEYWEVIGKKCSTEEERKEFEYRYARVYEPLAVLGFNDDDVFAREAMQPFYADGTGWAKENMCSFDGIVVAWRKLVAQHARGFQNKKP